MATAIPFEIPTVLEREIDELASIFTYEKGTHVLSHERRDKIEQLIFVGGWVRFKDENETPIPLSELPKLFYVKLQ